MRRRPPTRLVMPPVSRSVERDYRRYLRRRVERNRKRLQRDLLPAAERLLKGSASQPPSGLDVISRIINELLRDSMSDLPTEAERDLMRFATALSHAHRRAFAGALMARKISVDLTDNEDLKRLLDYFVADNLQLIASLNERQMQQTDEVVRDAILRGSRVEHVAHQIEQRASVAASRATLIARDQYHKTLGKLVQARQTAIGIMHYHWRTSLDERVRKSHRSLQCLRFSWHDPPDVGHPGSDYQCRCTADPDIGALLFRTAA